MREHWFCIGWTAVSVGCMRVPRLPFLVSRVVKEQRGISARISSVLMTRESPGCAAVFLSFAGLGANITQIRYRDRD